MIEAFDFEKVVCDGPATVFQERFLAYVVLRWLQKEHNLYLVGLEKSGSFVEHAQEIQNAMKPGQVFVIPNKYIYQHITPGEESSKPYGWTSNYGHKVIYKTPKGQMHVASIPVPELKMSPAPTDLPNLWVLLDNIEKLHCDMYDSALFPVALVNKLVSLSSHPSQKILQNFAKAGVPSK